MSTCLGRSVIIGGAIPSELKVICAPKKKSQKKKVTNYLPFAALSLCAGGICAIYLLCDSSTPCAALPYESNSTPRATASAVSRQIPPVMDTPQIIDKVEGCACDESEPVAFEELFKCCLLGSAEGVHIALKSGVNPHQKMKKGPFAGFNILHVASLRGHAKIVESLIELGMSADTTILDSKTWQGWSSITLARDKRHSKVLSILENSVA